MSSMEIKASELKERVQPYLALPPDEMVNLDELVNDLSGCFLAEDRPKPISQDNYEQGHKPHQIDREEPL